MNANGTASVKTSVFDSYAVIAFFENEDGAHEVERLSREVALGTRAAKMSRVNWGELYYIMLRRHGREVLHETLVRLQLMQIEVVPVDEDMTRRAAEIKAENKMSYADAFTVALAMMCQGEIVTGDPEFRAVEKKVPLHWIGKKP